MGVQIGIRPLSRGGARRRAAIAAARCSSHASRALGRNATALPGLVAQRIDPRIMAELRDRAGPIAIVVGTNGKTTTTRLLARILEDVTGRTPVSNRSGANLSQGIVTALLAARPVPGTAPAAVFEVDELALPEVASQLRPEVVVILNLVRDQLDRYGEVDAVERRWIDALDRGSASPTLVVCADDPRLESIAGQVHLPVRRFGIDGVAAAAETPAARLDRQWMGAGLSAPCPRCAAPTDVDDASASGGTWRCMTCGLTRSPLDLGVRFQGTEDRWLRLGFELRSGREVDRLPAPNGSGHDLGTARVRLVGTAGAYDAAAAVLAAITLGFEPEQVVGAIDGATPAFGRLEELTIDGREVILSLAKNPASAAQAAEAAAARKPDRMLIGLGDQPADGRDVSWIWDARIDALARLAPLILTGERALDLALRFKYGGAGAAPRFGRPLVEPELERAFGDAISQVPPGGTLMVLGTYTTLLGIRRMLERRGEVAAMPK